MDWTNLRTKRPSFSGLSAPPKLQPPAAHGRFPISNNYTTNTEYMLNSGAQGENRASYYVSQYPLFCADWISGNFGELAAVSSFREGFQNRIQVLGGVSRPVFEESDMEFQGDLSPGPNGHNPGLFASENTPQSVFDFTLLAEAPTDYPVTSLQWEPHGRERLAASSEALRLFRVSHEYGEAALVQTHLLANNSTANSSNNGGSSANSASKNDINTFPPVTAFDWNKCDPSVVITSSVDTTCTVWDLSRTRAVGKNHDSAHVKTQLIAHDSEVFDVKFVHMSTDVFASVSNDGSMRVFDLRSLEHSTIIYEPTAQAITGTTSGAGVPGANYNPQALLRLSASNTDQHTLATVGVNSNQVLIIDLRMPGVPVATVDASFDGQSNAAINSIQWHPSRNLLATGGDDCQALVWDCSGGSGHRLGADSNVVIDTPVLAYSEDLEVNNVCWRRDSRTDSSSSNNNNSSWMGVVSGKGFQGLDAS